MNDLYIGKGIEWSAKQEEILKSWDLTDRLIWHNARLDKSIRKGISYAQFLDDGDMVVSAIRKLCGPQCSYVHGRDTDIVPGFDRNSLLSLERQGIIPTGENFDGGPMFIDTRDQTKTQLPYGKIRTQ